MSVKHSLHSVAGSAYETIHMYWLKALIQTEHYLHFTVYDSPALARDLVKDLKKTRHENPERRKRQVISVPLNLSPIMCEHRYRWKIENAFRRAISREIARQSATIQLHSVTIEWELWVTAKVEVTY